MQPSFIRRGFCLVEVGFWLPLVVLAQHFCACSKKSLYSASGNHSGSELSVFCLPQDLSCCWQRMGAQMQSPFPSSHEGAMQTGAGHPPAAELWGHSHHKASLHETFNKVFSLQHLSASAFSWLRKHELSIRTPLFCKDTEHWYSPVFYSSWRTESYYIEISNIKLYYMEMWRIDVCVSTDQFIHRLCGS